MTVADWVLKNFEPELAWLLSRGRLLEETLGPSDDWVERDRRILFEAANAVLEPLGRPTVQEVTAVEHITTVPQSPDKVEQLLHPMYSRNLLSMRKYREFNREARQWAQGSWVYDPSWEPWQHHVYVFPAKNGGTAIYGHKESSVRDPGEHLDTSNSVHGDPDNLLDDVL